MRYFFDTEFMDEGTSLKLISLGIVAEDGRTFYRENAGFDPASGHEWLQKFVIPMLGESIVTLETMKADLIEFIGEDDDPQFWAYFASYDWMMLCSIFGGMMKVPDTWPNFTRDIQIVRMQLGGIRLPPQLTIAHHALNDARWTKEAFEYLVEYATMGGVEDLLFR